MVPAITWLGLDQVDDDGDGLPNTLEQGGPVKWPRVIAGDHGLPATFADQTAPLLVLPRPRAHPLRPDLGHRAGPLTRPARHRPRGRGPRRLAALGPAPARAAAAALRRGRRPAGELRHREPAARGAPVRSTRLTQPTQPTPIDAFGARLEPLRRPRAGEDGRTLPLTALADDPALGLLTGSDGVVPAFGRLEESQARPDAADGKVVTALGQDVTEAERTAAEEKGEQPRTALPAFTAARLGKGVVVRVGLTDWVLRAGTDREVGQITRNIIDVLRRVKPRVRSATPVRIPSSTIRSRSGVMSRSVVVGKVSAARVAAAVWSCSCGVTSSGAGSPYQSSARRVAGEQRAGEVELERVEDRDRGGHAGQAHPLRLPDREAGRHRGRDAADGDARGVDRDRAGRPQQLTRLRLEMEALEPLGEQQDEKLLFHRCLTL